MVHRGLHCPEARIPSLDCRYALFFLYQLNWAYIILGFDLVGYENDLKPLIDYIEPLLNFQKRQKELGIDIPFIFHAGETLGDGTKADVNLYDALLMGTKRIGHG